MIPAATTRNTETDGAWPTGGLQATRCASCQEGEGEHRHCRDDDERLGAQLPGKRKVREGGNVSEGDRSTYGGGAASSFPLPIEAWNLGAHTALSLLSTDAN